MLPKPPKDSGLCDALASPTCSGAGTCCRHAWRIPAGSRADCVATYIHLAIISIIISSEPLFSGEPEANSPEQYGQIVAEVATDYSREIRQKALS